MKLNISTYYAVLDTYAKSGDLEKGVVWLSGYMEARLKPYITTYNSVLDLSLIHI